MKVYKAIFRLDYPISFKVIDSLGSYVDFISQKLQKTPFSKFKSNIDFVNHSLEAKANIDSDEGACRFSLSAKTLDVIIEYKKGLSIEKLSKNPVSEIFDEIIKKLSLEGFSNYDRFGIRLWVVDSNSGFKFSDLLDHFLKVTRPVEDIFKKQNFPPNDIGIVIDSKNEEDVRMHLQYGPYQKSEEKKYFSLKPEIEEGLIMDIDISQRKISIPNFSFLNLAKRYQNYFVGISSDLIEFCKKKG